MKFIQRLADGLWVSGQANGYSLYTGWIDLRVHNLHYDKKVWVDLTIIQTMLGQDTAHQASISAEYKETLPDGTERWGCHTPEFPPVMGYPGMVSYIKEASYKARLIVEDQEISDLERYILYRYHPQPLSTAEERIDPLSLISSGVHPSAGGNAPSFFNTSHQ